MNNAARAAVLEAHCRELKLPSVRRLYPDLVRQATHDGWDYEEFLLQLLEAEVLTRRDGPAGYPRIRGRAVARLLRQARFPDLKTFEQLDWEALGGVERPQLAQLATCEYIERADDVVIAGPIGTGKTHFAIALGVEAARRINADATAATLDRIVAGRGTAPGYIRCDNGPELTANALRDWCRFSGTASSYIEPGAPWENPYVESFNGRLRDEFLAVEQFDSRERPDGVRAPSRACVAVGNDYFDRLELRAHERTDDRGTGATTASLSASIASCAAPMRC